MIVHLRADLGKGGYDWLLWLGEKRRTKSNKVANSTYMLRDILLVSSEVRQATFLIRWDMTL